MPTAVPLGATERDLVDAYKRPTCFDQEEMPHFTVVSILHSANRFQEAAVIAERAVAQDLTVQDGSDALFAFDLYTDALIVLGWMGEDRKAACRDALYASVDELLKIDVSGLRRDHFLRAERDDLPAANRSLLEGCLEALASCGREARCAPFALLADDVRDGLAACLGGTCEEADRCIEHTLDEYGCH